MSGSKDSEFAGLQDIIYEGAIVNGKQSQVFAYIGYPDGQAPKDGFPGIVLIHGGGTAYPGYIKLWTTHGYAVIAID